MQGIAGSDVDGIPVLPDPTKPDLKPVCQLPTAGRQLTRILSGIRDSEMERVRHVIPRQRHFDREAMQYECLLNLARDNQQCCSEEQSDRQDAHTAYLSPGRAKISHDVPRGHGCHVPCRYSAFGHCITKSERRCCPTSNNRWCFVDQLVVR